MPEWGKISWLSSFSYGPSFNSFLILSPSDSFRITSRRGSLAFLSLNRPSIVDVFFRELNSKLYLLLGYNLRKAFLMASVLRSSIIQEIPRTKPTIDISFFVMYIFVHEKLKEETDPNLSRTPAGQRVGGPRQKKRGFKGGDYPRKP